MRNAGDIIRFAIGVGLVSLFFFKLAISGPAEVGWTDYVCKLFVGSILAASHGVGWLLPRLRKNSWSIELPYSPTTIWEVLVDESRLPEWVPGLESVMRMSDEQGRAIRREDYSDCSVRVEIAESIAPFRLVQKTRELISPTQVEDRFPSGIASYGLIWEIASTDGGSQLTLTHYAELDGALLRFYATFIMRLNRMRRTTNCYFQALTEYLHQQATSTKREI